MRVVLDTNVLVSGVLGLQRSASIPGEIVRQWRRGAFVLIMSGPIVEEVERTLGNPYFTSRISDVDRELLITALHVEADYHPHIEAVHGVASHPEDDLILATAVSGGVELIVTGDKQLLRLGEFRGVAVVLPLTFLDRLEDNLESRVE